MDVESLVNFTFSTFNRSKSGNFPFSHLYVLPLICIFFFPYEINITKNRQNYSPLISIGSLNATDILRLYHAAGRTYCGIH